VGTTKLTRKEILAEDPVHGTLVTLIEYLKIHGNKVAMLVAAAVLVGLGIYGGMQYLESRDARAQERLTKGMEFMHAQVSPDAADDPYGKGSSPLFKSDALKYQAAIKEFSSVISQYSYSKASILARYYLGLAQVQLGQKQEATKNLESVANNSRNRAVGNLAKRALASNYLDSGNFKAARESLEGMLKDGQCDLPKEDLSIQLSRVLVAQGKRDEAIKVLREATPKEPSFGPLEQQVAMELDKLQKAAKVGAEPSSTPH
jgi:predicted negative regulator of RcsB-dependent stress response